MANVKIVTDSCSDLGKDIREKYDILYAKMNTVYKGEETPASLDWESYSPKELYDIMRNGERVLTTQVPVEEFKKVFTNILEEGNDIVYIGCSVKLSGSINIASIVANELKEEYPERTIKCVDSLNSCMGEGALAVYAAKLRNDGMSAEEIADKV
ncbi:MAG: DegV family protein, partial [Ruminococcus sp.]